MKEKDIHFFRDNVDILEKFLEYLWKTPIKVKEKIIYTEEKLFTIDFITEKEESIKMKAKLEWIAGELIVRLKYNSYKDRKSDGIKNSLLLSFCYKCPEELGLCNQYGLYRKEDIKNLESLNDIDLIHKYQIEKNILGNNQIFIFNMNKIREHCSDKVLDQILQEFNKSIKDSLYQDN
ncbi:MAG: hypothetical protein HFH08_00955 [Bacilli bacterium]|nr:hypothetical protein [Bacilli bacterium]